MSPRLAVVLSWIVTLATPLALLGLALRAVLLPFYPAIEYHMPYFPDDEYGFTTEDRVRWAGEAWQYLLRDADSGLLADSTFEDGRPFYNDRELRHMADVKVVIQGSLRVWYADLIAMAGLTIWAWRAGWRNDYVQGLRRGGWLMVGLAGVIAVIVAVGLTLDEGIFWGFFTFFHALFFEGDSWLFLYSDTLIRLFPIRFWQDTFLFAAFVALGGGLTLGIALKHGG